MEPIGIRIKRLRIANKLSQRDLATDHVTFAYISRIESGDRVPSEKALREIAPKLGVTPHYLESGENSGACPHCLQEVEMKVDASKVLASLQLAAQ